MNSPRQSRVALSVYFIAALGAFVIVAALAWFLYARTRPTVLNQARIDERIKYLREINALGTDALNSYGWQDQSKSLIRVPITNAMKMIVRDWKNPAAGRSNLLARVAKANPPPPPKPPEKPSEFE